MDLRCREKPKPVIAAQWCNTVNNSGHVSAVSTGSLTACISLTVGSKYDLFHGRTRTACLYRCVWSGIMGR